MVTIKHVYTKDNIPIAGANTRGEYGSPHLTEISEKMLQKYDQTNKFNNYFKVSHATCK
jgi:hypothetical protein